MFLATELHDISEDQLTNVLRFPYQQRIDNIVTNIGSVRAWINLIIHDIYNFLVK